MTLNRIEAEEDNRSMRYDTIVEFNVDSKAEFDQAHETKTKKRSASLRFVNEY